MPLPIFENILSAQKWIRKAERKAPALLGVMPPSAFMPDPYVAAGAELTENDFIVTRLDCRDSDVLYYRMLAQNGGIPYLTDFNRYSLKPNLFNKHFLYRGQHKEWKSIKPNLFRDEAKGYFLDDMIKVQEMSAFISQHPLVQLLGIKGFELNGEPTKFQCNLYGLAQHYYNKTTQVDFSSSLDVASFFAVTRYDVDTDCYKPLDLGSNSKGVIYVLGIDSSLANNRIFGFDITSIGKQYCFERPARQLGFLVAVERGKDLINHPKLIKVEFRHNAQIARSIYNKWDCGNLIAPSDPLEQYWHKYRDKKGEAFEVSEKALELNVWQNQEETRDSIIEKLKHYHLDDGKAAFKLSNLVYPHFPEELLEEYYSNIRNGWWEDVYCKNIYFPFDNRGKMKNALLKLPQDERYRRAFYR